MRFKTRQHSGTAQTNTKLAPLVEADSFLAADGEQGDDLPCFDAPEEPQIPTGSYIAVLCGFRFPRKWGGTRAELDCRVMLAGSAGIIRQRFYGTDPITRNGKVVGAKLRQRGDLRKDLRRAGIVLPPGKPIPKDALAARIVRVHITQVVHGWDGTPHADAYSKVDRIEHFYPQGISLAEVLGEQSNGTETTYRESAKQNQPHLGFSFPGQSVPNQSNPSREQGAGSFGGQSTRTTRENGQQSWDKYRDRTKEEISAEWDAAMEREPGEEG